MSNNWWENDKPSGGTVASDKFWEADAALPSFIDRAGRYVKGALKSAGQGLTLGYADEIGSAIDATLPMRSLIAQARPISQADSWGQRYDENLARERGEAKQFSKDNPVTSTAANVAGNVAGAYALSGAPLIGAVLRGSPGVGVNILKGAVGGGVLGGAQGFGEGEGGFGNRTKNAVMPAVVGTAVGGALPTVGAGVGYAYEKWAPGTLRYAGDVADKFAKKVKPESLSAAAPEGGSMTQDGLAATLADNFRTTAVNIEDNAALKRLALEISRSGGTGRARNRLGELGEDAFLADTSKGAERLAELGATLKGDAPDKYAAAYTARNERTGERFLKAMGEHADAPGVSRFDKFFEGYRSGKGAEIYDPVLRSGKFNVSDELTSLSQRPSIKKALETVDEWAAAEGKTLSEAERFHMVKQALNQNADAAFASGKPINKKMVGDTASEWEQALYAANPAIKEADSAYAKIASLPEWRDRGLNFMKKGYGDDAVASSADALADELPRATAQQRTAAAVGSSNVMADAAKSGANPTRRLADAISTNSLLKSKLVELYGPEVAERLIQQSRTELAFQAGNQAVNGGSPTGRRIASMMDEAALTAPPTSGGDISALLGWVKDTYGKVRQPSEAVRSKLADLLANPDPRINAETLSLIEALLKQQGAARPINAGISGAAGGSFASPR